MRKFFVLIVSLVLFASAVTAQYVNIPDNNFRNFLISRYPSCFNGNGQMDTTCSAIVNEVSLVTNEAVRLEGIRYFKNLRYLDCSYGSAITDYTTLPGLLEYFNCSYNNSLATLPSLPNTLKYFICEYNNQITTVPNLPASLIYLDCHYLGQVRTLPALPAGLKYLNCSSSFSLTGLPALPASLDTIKCNDCYIDLMPALPPGLIYLDCANNPSLANLPALPNTLTYLNCCNNSAQNGIMSALPALPTNLKYLNCKGNAISSIPALPDSIVTLICSGNPLGVLPSVPPGLVTLECGGNGLTTLPSLPNSLKTLSFGGNRFSSFPVLPATLEYLDCSGNPLHTIPGLPDSLKYIYCYNDSLTSLPVLPAQLEVLFCIYNELTSLPALPAHLTELNCRRNQLTSLPALPQSINYIECQWNNIYCLPKLPVSEPGAYSYLSISFDGDKIKCLPNRPQYIAFNVYDSTGNSIGNPVPPLCNPVNNLAHCESFPVMAGTVFYDYNNNGIKEANELVRPNVRLDLSTGYYTFTNRNGYFEIGADSLGAYTLTATPPRFYNLVPASNTYNFTSYDTLVTQDYALQANATVDSLSIHVNRLSRARPGFSLPYYISYENPGTTALSPNIVFNYDNARLIYDSSSNAAVTNNGSSLSLPVGNFLPGQEGNFLAYFTVRTTAALGDSLFAKATISANGNNYADSIAIIIGGAFDPNDKEATPQLTPSQVAAGKYIDYTIRFQNTGTDTAFNVVISDTLNGDLQANTLQMLAASHSCKTTVKDGIAYFEFLNILLPDSNVNEVKSHGFVNFKIQPKPTVAVNTIIPNKAAIYFDYNSPVITNTAGTLIKNFAVVPLHLLSFSAVPQTDNTTTLYWTTANEINIKSFVIGQSADGRIFNAVGTVLSQGRASNSYSKTVTDVPNAVLQFYRIKMIDINGEFSYTPIVKISRQKNAAGFSLLSNPVKDWINITTTDASLFNSAASIVNSNGTVVKTFILQQGVQNVSVNELSSGIYYLRTENGSIKFIITK